MNFSAEIFAERLNNLIKERELTFVNVARELEISRSAITQMRKGEILPSVKTLVAIANYLSVSLDYLTGRTDNQEVNK